MASDSAPIAMSPNRGTIRVIPVAQGALWQAVLQSIGRFDFYHTADYHALRESREDGHGELVVYSERERLVAVPLLVREIPGSGTSSEGTLLYDASSVYGYAGWLSSAGTDVAMAARFGQALEQYLRGRRVVSVFSRMHPLLDPCNVAPSVGIVEGAGTTVGLPLHEGLAAYEGRVAKSHRYEICKLRKAGCTVLHDRELVYLEEFVRMYSATMTRLCAKRHYFLSMEEMRQMFQSRQFEAQLHVALKDANPCAMSIMVRCGDLLQYHLSCSQDGIVRYPATKLLLDSVCREAIASGVKWFHLGGGVGGRHDSLFTFKLAFGGTVLQFNTWKWVVRSADYERLASMARPEAGSFFPSYRFGLA